MGDSQEVEAIVASRDAVLDDLWRQVPGLAQRGERFRRFCADDILHHLEHLAAAVSLKSPGLFHAYVAWVQAVLEPRGLGPECLAPTWDSMRRVCLGLDLGGYRDVASAALEPGHLAPAASPPHPPETTGGDVSAYVSAALAGDRGLVLDLVARRQASQGVPATLTLVAQAQEQVGEMWVRNQVTVADEHRATALSQLALSVLAPFTAGAPGPRPRGRAVVTCAPGDWHTMGPRIGADLLECAGYEVEFLGGNLPVEDLHRAVSQLQPALVGIGATPWTTLPAARSAVAAAREACPSARVVVAGFAARVAGAGPLGADVVLDARFAGTIP
jgi:methanogenic corrinoid protein MtbC1